MLLYGRALAGGFSIDVGLGGGFWHLPEGSLAGSLQKAGRYDARQLTQTLSSGFSIRLSFSYNFYGWASVEAGFSGHGWNLAGDDIGGTGIVGAAAHFHPLQLWWPERRFDASVFLGGDWAILGGGHESDNANRGLTGGAIECGLKARYRVTSWFSAGVDLRFYVPFFKTWIVDWGDEEYSLPDSPSGLFTQLLAVATFHMQPAE
ncbi:MAG: hypothetical protein D6806_03305 [Deltaproteobacteria bacterium]|nr:MAG: hypothetical protein D6806_03305 [Deltaproteobacteria bacterium]